MSHPPISAENSDSVATGAEPLQLTALDAAHRALGARMVPFAGYAMPVQYADGILAEHLWTRAHAGLFDVSHMGQAFLIGPDHGTTARALEALVPADLLDLPPGRQRYGQILNARGGIIDDLMIARSPDPEEDGALFLIVNAGRKAVDYAHITAEISSAVTLSPVADRALLALQGPEAEAVMLHLGADVAGMSFMAMKSTVLAGIDVSVSRSGYTGEDGFEISVRSSKVVALWEALLAAPEVKPIGLGARDSLRLEAGLCLYGHDIDETTSPIEAGLQWSIPKRRRQEGGFAGYGRIARELREGPERCRVGLRLIGRQPAREGAQIATPDGKLIGIVTSGGFGPTIAGPIALGYVPPAFAAPGTMMTLIVRDKPLPAEVVPLPFVPARYKRAALKS